MGDGRVRRSGGCSAPSTRPRCSSGWPCSPGRTCSSTTSWSPPASCPTAAGEPVTIAGVVTQVRARHEGASFDSDVFAIADGTLPAQVQEAAEITTTRVEPEIYVPPAPGALVRRAGGAERDGALYFDRMERRVPIGAGRDGEPLYLNAEFLDGTRGAHVSISGISGVATKTSFATWLLYSVFRSGVLGGAGETANTRALIFNVKGEDLLFLDHPNTRLDADTRSAYARLGLDAGPFPDVCVYAPPRAGDLTGAPDVASRLTGVDSFYWTHRRVLRRPAAALRLRRRRRRPPAVHDGRARGRGVPAAQRRAGRRRRGHRRRTGRLLPGPGRPHRSSASPTTRPAASGPAPRSGWARSTRSCAGSSPAAATCPG